MKSISILLITLVFLTIGAEEKTHRAADYGT